MASSLLFASILSMILMTTAVSLSFSSAGSTANGFQWSTIAPILSHLGFEQLATAAPSLTDSPKGPYTIFAPSDSSLRTCIPCSVPNLLREHIVPGLYTFDFLRRYDSGTKMETLSPGRCITITSEENLNASNSKVFIGGMEMTQPDVFNNGVVAIHGIQGFVSPLSSSSCEIEQLIYEQLIQQPAEAIMSLMLRDTILRLRSNGFRLLFLAMKFNYDELVNLSNMTVFALDDASIFSDWERYISWFHIVPNHLLTMADLQNLPLGTSLPTLNRCQNLTVTTAGGGSGIGGAVLLRINNVRVRIPEVIQNMKIVVHSLLLPFPHEIEIPGGGEGSGEASCRVPDHHDL